MGTNFYWRFNACEPCRRYDEAHVGKRSAGWSFGFRAYLHQLVDPQHPDWGYEQESPFGIPVLSRADWRTVFESHPGELWDEYRQRVDDPLAWLDELVPPDAEKQAREWSPERMGRWWRLDSSREWRDAEGFRFYAGEFS